MKNILLPFLFIFLQQTVNAQLIARLELKEPIEGLCDYKDVYALFSGFTGQSPSVCTLSKEEITTRLNNEVTFLKDKPKYKGEGMVNILVNCKGEVVQCRTSNKTKSPELDEQILKVFTSLKKFSIGSLNEKPVDNSLLFSFKIKKGKITLN